MADPVTAEQAADRAGFDPARTWPLVAGLVDAGRARDPDAYAAAVEVLRQAEPSLNRNAQRVGVALAIHTLSQVVGLDLNAAHVQRLAIRVEPEIRRFMRANRWDIEDALTPVLLGVGPPDFARAMLVGCGVVSVLIDSMPPVDEVARSADSYLEDARKAALLMAARQLAGTVPPGPEPGSKSASRRGRRPRPEPTPSGDDDMPVLP